MNSTPGAPVNPPGTARPRVNVNVRLARFGDVRPLTAIYMGQTPTQRHGYHPFPFSRPVVFLSYLMLVTGQTLFDWLMRRSTRLLRLIFVAQLEGDPAIAGSATLRGVIRPGNERFLRFGFCVSGGYQGKGVGRTLLGGLATAGVERGYHRGIGAIFMSDARGVPAVTAAGFRLTPTQQKDPFAPEEANFLAEADLDEMARIARERNAAPT
ncbi:MAG: GNAT family N-acetyltransferase [Thermoplasmata archaeon]|nr:GNAT family N-acetyltransferase [Thermoplasmata archaeon]